MNNESEKKQEVTVTDIQMRFWSMVIFMVKWTIASIPALIILVMLAIGFSILLAGVLRPFFFQNPLRPSSAASEQAAPSSEPSNANPEESAYLSKILVRNVSVSRGELGETGVFGEVKNTGDRTLKEVEITIYCLGSDGKPVFEKTYNPVLVTEMGFGDAAQPLKAGYSRQFGVKMDDAPSEWAKKVDVKVTKIEFQ